MDKVITEESFFISNNTYKINQPVSYWKIGIILTQESFYLWPNTTLELKI